MFEGCTSLTTAPELPALTLAECCYWAMFKDCTKLESVTMLAIDGFDKIYCLTDWLNNAGTDTSVNWKTLKILSDFVYKDIESTLPDNWNAKTSSKVTILNIDDEDITQDATLSSTAPLR